MTTPTPQRKRDAEQALVFAKLYLKEVQEESEKSPLAWRETLLAAERAVARAQATLDTINRAGNPDTSRSCDASRRAASSG